MHASNPKFHPLDHVLVERNQLTGRIILTVVEFCEFFPVEKTWYYKVSGESGLYPEANLIPFRMSPATAGMKFVVKDGECTPEQ